MSAISAMPGAIAQWLGEQEPLQDVGFLTEYPAANKAVPLRSAIVAVGVDTVAITDKFAENDDGVLERQEYCRTAVIRLRLGVHVPFAEGGDRCHEIFTSVLDMLTFASDLNIPESGCGDVAAHRDTDAFVLEAWAEIIADFCPAESTGLTLTSFLSKDLLCGSHIGNGDIHLSAAEKGWVDAPFRTGTYLGSGAATQNIELGLHPRAVFAFAADLPVVYANFTGGAAQSYFGYATREGGTQGLSVTATGFRLRSGAAVAAGTTTAALNLAYTPYVYFAVA
ncbi:MAG: hypothetical protein LBS96_01690 [Oscillospiraceae bacterium]|jgi:hypothetical protein|nr:hypothetical protein [Oscillospiraceae bacterium]